VVVTPGPGKNQNLDNVRGLKLLLGLYHSERENVRIYKLSTTQGIFNERKDQTPQREVAVVAFLVPEIKLEHDKNSDAKASPGRGISD